MNIISVTKCDQLNGDGLRVVLWCAGCTHHCEGCHNEYSWDCTIGVPFDESVKQEIYHELQQDWCTGLTLSGGDPLFPSNRDEIIEFVKEIKQRFPDKTIWLYTGYRWSDILSDKTMSEILPYIDILCDGEYIKELRNVDLKWVGSSNQEIIDVKKRLSDWKHILNTV